MELSIEKNRAPQISFPVQTRFDIQSLLEETSNEDPKWKERDPPPPPLINLDLSKESICKKTLELVDKEVKAIAVTIDLDVGEKQIDNEMKVAESSGKIPINIKHSQIICITFIHQSVRRDETTKSTEFQ